MGSNKKWYVKDKKIFWLRKDLNLHQKLSRSIRQGASVAWKLKKISASLKFCGYVSLAFQNKPGNYL